MGSGNKSLQGGKTRRGSAPSAPSPPPRTASAAGPRRSGGYRPRAASACASASWRRSCRTAAFSVRPRGRRSAYEYFDLTAGRDLAADRAGRVADSSGRVEDVDKGRYTLGGRHRAAIRAPGHRRAVLVLCAVRGRPGLGGPRGGSGASARTRAGSCARVSPRSCIRCFLTRAVLSPLRGLGTKRRSLPPFVRPCGVL